MQETTACAYKDLRRVADPVDLEKCPRFGVQQRVATVKTVVIALFAREFGAG